MNIDWEKAGGSGGSVYPVGTYRVCISGFEEVTAGTGTPQLRWRATILQPVELMNKTIVLHTPLTEAALWKTAKLVGACGVELKTLGKMEVGSDAFLKVLSNCVGKSTFWHLSIVPDNKGRDKNEVDDFRLDKDQIIREKEDDTPPFLKG